MVKSGDKKTIAVDSFSSLGTVSSHITVSKDLKKYFRHFDFWSRYDDEIVANRSILGIPVLATVLPFAWVTGADVYVDELDRRFAESVTAVHREYKKMYPGLPYRSKLVANRLVDNEYESDETALLFSGGLDATYSLFSNMALKPRLIIIFGTSDIPISNVRFQKLLEREYSRFAEREGLTLNFIRTNMMGILDVSRVDHLFGSLSKYDGRPDGYVWTDHWPHYWDGIGFMLAHSCQAAPLSIGRFSRLISAGFGSLQKKYPGAQHPTEKTKWANITIAMDGQDKKRYEKAIFLKEFVGAHKFKLRVCLEYLSRSPDKLNCNECEKCLQTITECMLAGIDPNGCGFSADQQTLELIRMRLTSPYSFSSQEIADWWKPLLQAIPNETELNYSAKQFFDFMKRVDIDSIVRHENSFLSKCYHRLPYPISHILRVVWEKTPARRTRFYTDLALARV